MQAVEYPGGETIRIPGWKLDKTFNLQNLLTSLIILGAVFAYLSRLESRLSTVESAILTQREKDKAQDERLSQLHTENREDHKAISAKLDEVLKSIK